MTEGTLPHSLEAERSIVGAILALPDVAPHVVGSLLAPEHFYDPALKMIYTDLVESYYADDPIDPIVIGERLARRLGSVWNIEDDEAAKRVIELSSGQRQFAQQRVKDHALVVKKHADRRALLDLSATIKRQVEDSDEDPDVIAGAVSAEAMRVATDTLHTAEIHEFGDLGRRYLRDLRMEKAARDQGVEMGVYFGLRFIDDYTRGIRPTELVFCGGEPGAGKSAVWWKAALMYSERQAKKPQGEQVGTLILSLEMGENPSSARLASAVSKLDGGRLREGDVDDAQIQMLTREWAKRKDIPLYVNHASTLKCSQLRALIVESIRRHNVGLVIIDHFRYFDSDRRFNNKNDEDDEKVRFLKEQIAKELNVAVVCLAHTTKGMESSDRRPNLSDLRGSGQIAADADAVCFVYRPYPYASEKAIDTGQVHTTDGEMLWRKNRSGLAGTADFYFDPSILEITD